MILDRKEGGKEWFEGDKKGRMDGERERERRICEGKRKREREER